MPALRDTDTFKNLLFLNVMKDSPELVDKFVDNLGRAVVENTTVKDAKELKKNGFGTLVGTKVHSGRSFENFLKSEGVWKYYSESTAHQLTHPKVVADAKQRQSNFDEIEKANPYQAKLLLIESATSMSIDPKIKKAFEMKKAGKSNFSKAIVSALGAKDLSLGVWVEIYRGMADTGLRTSVGGRVGQMFESGSIHEIAIGLQKRVVATAKKYELEVATEIKAALKNLAAASMSVVAVVSLAMAQFTADDHPRVVQAFEDSNPSYQTYLDAAEVNVETLQANLGGLKVDAKELTEEQSLSASQLLNENSEPNVFESLIRDAVGGASSDYLVQSGDSIWTVSANIADLALGGMEYALNEQGSPTEYETIVANISSKIILANSLDNPDYIVEDQTLVIPSSIVDSIEGDLEAKLDFAANTLESSQKQELKRTISAPKI